MSIACIFITCMHLYKLLYRMSSFIYVQANHLSDLFYRSHYYCTVTTIEQVPKPEKMPEVTFLQYFLSEFKNHGHRIVNTLYLQQT